MTRIISKNMLRSLKAGEVETFTIGSRSDLYKVAWDQGYRAGLEAAQPKWISVEERLPLEDGQCVLCAVKDYWGVAVCEGRYSKVSNRIWPNDEDCVLDEVTHWMPLPEPPKEET